MVDGGYTLETLFMQSLIISSAALAHYQIFYIWRLPHNRDRVKILQKTTLTTVVFDTTLGFVVCLDHRGAYRLFPPAMIGAIAIFLTYPMTPTILVWYKEFLDIVIASSRSYDKLQAYLQKFTIQYWHIGVISAIHIVLTIILMIMALVTDHVWQFVFMFVFYLIIALFICGIAFFLSFLIWQQYKKLQAQEEKALEGKLDTSLLAKENSTNEPSKKILMNAISEEEEGSLREKSKSAVSNSARKLNPSISPTIGERVTANPPPKVLEGNLDASLLAKDNSANEPSKKVLMNAISEEEQSFPKEESKSIVSNPARKLNTNTSPLKGGSVTVNPPPLRLESASSSSRPGESNSVWKDRVTELQKAAQAVKDAVLLPEKPETKLDRYFKTLVTTIATGLVSGGFVLGLIIIMWRISNPDLTLTSELRPDPNVYTFNFDIFGIFFCYIVLDFFGLYTVWLPRYVHPSDPTSAHLRSSKVTTPNHFGGTNPGLVRACIGGILAWFLER
jgi:hypothetical protein